MPRRLDVVSKRFGRLLVISLHPEKNKWGDLQYLVRCDCGTEVVRTVDNLVRGTCRSCGCLQSELVSKRRGKQLTGKKFGYLIVLEFDSKAKNGSYRWKCRCTRCGKITIKIGSDITTGRTKSCDVTSKTPPVSDSVRILLR